MEVAPVLSFLTMVRTNHSYLIYVIASVAIDTSELKKANVKIEFSIITFRKTMVMIALDFPIEQILPVWPKDSSGHLDLERDFESDEAVDTSDSFAFISRMRCLPRLCLLHRRALNVKTRCRFRGYHQSHDKCSSSWSSG